MDAQRLADFYAAERWLHTLITDPTGSHYFQDKTPAAQLSEFQASLARLSDFLKFAGDPQTTFPAIHVTGTSGKGSVVSLTAAILAEAGLRVGHHVSPYLQVSTEKLLLNGQRASAAEFITLVQAFRAQYEQWRAAQGGGLNYGEAWMALTFLWLARTQVDWAVVETEVGGRYDPSNVLPARLAVITNVELDHVKMLGPTLADIAHHKAGIIKPDQLALTAVTDPTLWAVIEAEAQAKNARLYSLGRDFDFTVHEHTAQGARFSVQTPHHTYPELTVGLLGKFQASNAALAVTAVDLVAAHFGLTVMPDAVQTALRNAHFAGRMEVMQHEPLVILDGAHNPHKMRALTETLRTVYADKKISVVIGVLITKDVAAMLATLVPLAQRWFVTQPHVLGKPAMSAVDLAAAIQHLAPQATIEVVEQVQLGIERAVHSAEADSLVLVTGSLYMLGEARGYWVPVEELLENTQ